MRRLLNRVAVLSVLAVSVSACSNTGSTLPFAGSPNNAGGTGGTLVAGATGSSLLRFINGSPDYARVNICVDQTPFGGGVGAFATAAYAGTAGATGLFAVGGGIGHSVAVYPTSAAYPAGSECPTAPGPYLGTAPIAKTIITPANSTRFTIVLGGTAASSTFGLYVFAEPTFAVAPAGNAVVEHNAAAAFSTGKPSGVGFGICTTTATPCAAAVALAGAQGTPLAKVSTPAGAVTNVAIVSGLNSIPAGFYDGIGVPTGTPVPITSLSAPNEVPGQPYYIQLYAIDAPAGGLNLVALMEQTLGLPF